MATDAETIRLRQLLGERKPPRSSLIFSVGSQAASPTASSARCSGRSKIDAPPRDHPRASDGPFGAVLGKTRRTEIYNGQKCG